MVYPSIIPPVPPALFRNPAVFRHTKTSIFSAVMNRSHSVRLSFGWDFILRAMEDNSELLHLFEDQKKIKKKNMTLK